MLDHSKFMMCTESKKALDYLSVVGLSIGDMTRIILVILFDLIWLEGLLNCSDNYEQLLCVSPMSSVFQVCFLLVVKLKEIKTVFLKTEWKKNNSLQQ